MNAAIVFHLGLAAYTFAAILYVANLLRPAVFAARAGGVALAVGVAFHALSILARLGVWLDGGGLRIAEALSILALLTAGSYLVLGRGFRLPVVGAFVAPLVVALLVPAHLAPALTVELGPSILGVMLPFHIGVALGGIALFALGFGVALMYLLLEREVKGKRLGTLFRRLPSLELLDRLNHRLVVLGFVLLSATILTGVLFPQSPIGTLFLLEPKQAFSLTAWALCALVLVLRRTLGWRGRRVAVATMASFLLMVGAFAGVFVGGAT